MPIVTLSETKCACGRIKSKRTMNITAWEKELFAITPKMTNIFSKSNKRCWKCKNKPIISGELWGLSINKGEKNRLFCPECSNYIQQELDKVGFTNPNRKKQAI